MTQLLRLATAGSVDDGKSTLVGRLLHDTRSILADQLAELELASRRRGVDGTDLALLTDGLRAEREQGITIDVAYRYFATPKRSFILADTPGHVQYTRNMVTGASTARVAVILVDARAGLVRQTRQHLAVAALLGVAHVVLAVNKMDLVGYAPEVFHRTAAAFGEYAAGLGLRQVIAIPLSAKDGDNVVHRSTTMPWYAGPALLEHLELVPVGDDPTGQVFRMPVQQVIRPQSADHRDYRGYAGQLTSGILRIGDQVLVQPAGVTSRVVALDGLGGPLVEAFAPMSVTVRLADPVDVARGSLLAAADAPATVTRRLSGIVCWLSARDLVPGARLLLRTGTSLVPAIVDTLEHRLDVETLATRSADRLRMNDIGRVSVRTAEPVAVDDYRENPRTGAFLLIDQADGDTLAAGMIGDPLGTGSC